MKKSKTEKFEKSDIDFFLELNAEKPDRPDPKRPATMRKKSSSMGDKIK